MAQPLAIRFDNYCGRRAAARASGSSGSHLAHAAERRGGLHGQRAAGGPPPHGMRSSPTAHHLSTSVACAEHAHGRVREAGLFAARPERARGSRVRRHGSRSSMRPEIRRAERHGSRFRQVGALVW